MLGLLFYKDDTKYGTFRRSWGFTLVKTTRSHGKCRRIWSFNILGLVTSKTVHILARRLIMFVFDSSYGQNVLCEGGLLWLV